MPAELRSPVTGPRLAALSATALQSADFVTSATTGWMRADRIDSNPSPLISAPTTVAPQSAKWIAAPRPRPDAAPVTMTTPVSFGTAALRRKQPPYHVPRDRIFPAGSVTVAEPANGRV